MALLSGDPITCTGVEQSFNIKSAPIGSCLENDDGSSWKVTYCKKGDKVTVKNYSDSKCKTDETTSECAADQCCTASIMAFKFTVTKQEGNFSGAEAAKASALALFSVLVALY